MKQGEDGLNQRYFDAIPGTLALVALALALILAWLAPPILLVFAAALAAYSALRFVAATWANAEGLRRVRRAEQIDWRAWYASQAGPAALPWDAVHHVVILPNVGEPIDVLRRSLRRMAESSVAGQITVLLAMEAREAGAIDKARALLAEFDGHFARIDYTLHPDGLPEECRCKSANLAWALRWIRRELADVHPALVVTTMDADTLWHPRYFEALTCAVALDPARDRRIWQAPIRYHTSRDHVPLRLVNAYASMFELAFLTAPWWMSLPMSSYSLTFALLDASGGWQSDVIADEWHTTINAYIHSRGAVRVQPIYLPFLAGTATGDTLPVALVRRYRQSLRHAWGSKEFGYALHESVRHDLPVGRSLRLLTRIAHDVLLPAAGWVILAAGTQLPLVDPALRDQVFSAPPFLVMHAAFVLIYLSGLVVWWLDLRSRPSREVAGTELVLVGAGFLVMPLLLLVFATLPLLHAQMRLLVGAGLDFQVTQKQAA
jgi:hypothetical protein